MAGRLPPEYEYHVSSLQKPCLLPMWFGHELPHIHPPGSLKTIGGTAGHKILELSMLDSRVITDNNTQLQQVWFDRLLEANAADGETYNREQLERFAEESAEDFANQIINWWGWWDKNGGEIVLVESQWNMELSGASDKTAPYRMGGKIDMAYRHPEIGLILGDWKFGRMKKQNVRDQFVLDMDYQLATYALAMKQGRCETPDGCIITPGKPDMCLLWLMDDFSPYKVKSQIKVPSYMTDAKAAWLDERRQAAQAGVQATTDELHAAAQAKIDDAEKYPNNKAKQVTAANAEKRLQEHIASPKLYHLAGDMRGPCAHYTDALTDDTLDVHRQEMVARMGTTRMGGIVRVRGEWCAFCFWRKACLAGWEKKELDTIDWSAEVETAKQTLDAMENEEHHGNETEV